MSSTRGRDPRRARGAVAVVVVTVALLGLIIGPPIGVAGAQPGPDGAGEEETTDEIELVERYAPVLALRPQSEPCDTSAEQYAPAPADIVLDNPHMLLRQIGVGNPVVMAGPTAQDLFDMGHGFYIDFPGDAFKPDCLYEQDFRRYNDGRNAVVYAHIATQADEPDKLAIQYWFFWYYNKYNNLHEGDWEGIQLLFDVGSVAEALQTPPASIGYSQHFGGEIAAWGDDPDTKLELVDTHPVVYPAVGSHASYFDQALYLGRNGSQGFGCDDTQKATSRLEPDVVLLPDEVTDPNDPLAWLMFEGLWGEQRFGAFSGATGPITKSRWTEPVEWHSTLRSSSVAVPGGSETTTPYVATFCTVVEFGSRQYLTAQQSPFRTGVILAALGALVIFVTGRTEWNAVAALPVTRRRRLGQMLTTSARFYWQNGRVFAGIGAMYLVVAVAAALLVALVALALVPLGVVGTAVIGLLVIAVQYVNQVVVSAATARATDMLERGEAASVGDSYGAARARLATLVSTGLRAGFIVLGLAVTIVGIPWAVRQFVRYQIAIPLIMLEEQTDARTVLRKCSTLIQGRQRWLHTATVVVIAQGLVALASAVFGLGLLLAVNGLPLWAYQGLVAGVTALVLPFSALAMIMLFGNVKAEAGA